MSTTVITFAMLNTVGFIQVFKHFVKTKGWVYSAVMFPLSIGFVYLAQYSETLSMCATVIAGTQLFYETIYSGFKALVDKLIEGISK